MARNKFKEKNMGRTIENNETAAWASIENIKPKSRVPIPDEIQVKNAKEYVDTNQK